MSAAPLELIVRFQGQLIQRVPLTEDRLSIGRTPDNGLSLPHPQVARQHAELRLEGKQIFLVDLGSSSGTFVGETRLLANQPHLLMAATVLRIGPFELFYQAETTTEEVAEPVVAVTQSELLADVPLRTLPQPHTNTPAPLPVGPRSNYVAYLPGIYQDHEFLGRFLLIIEALWEPLEQRQDHLAMYFDPRTCAPSMLQYLSAWLDLPLNPFWPEPLQRVLLADALDLMRWRGTRYGLVRLIELVTGLTPEVLDEPNQPYVMRVRLSVPTKHTVDRDLIEDLIKSHKPAHIGYILELR
ncbi:MAG: FHA domain-containing protein [Candidatus Viridilinea halotolerans]|uniref:FHA domain-containing protein n=1 Tax=Candidatus Viridilinea halotolerans TaxID=2491704 RepID=A0A426TSC6_9CHLR|nr:MAG: FHA domain-containing protein [Candidatus Viridilinea halotolerans]